MDYPDIRTGNPSKDDSARVIFAQTYGDAIEDFDLQMLAEGPRRTFSKMTVE